MEMITKSYNELKKIAKKDKPGKNALKVALLGDCSTQYLRTAIIGAAIEKWGGGEH